MRVKLRFVVKVFMSLCFIVTVYKYTYANSEQSHLETENKRKSQVKNYILEKPLKIDPVLQSWCFTPNKHIGHRFKRRMSRIEYRCYDRNYYFQENWEHVKRNGSTSVRLIGDYSHLSINCLVLKAASSSWNDFYWKLREPDQWKTEDFWEKAIHGNRKTFVEIKPWKKMEMWNYPDAIRIVTARHPFARLLSGYKDKFNKVFYYKELFDKYPEMKKYTKKWGSWRGRNPNDYFMKWKDFARYVADHGADYRKNLDGHFHPITADCDPCQIPFNYVVKVETFNEDACWLVKEKFRVDPSLLKWQNGRKNLNISSNIRRYYSKLGTDIVERIYKIYENDFLVFGYTIDLKTFEVGGWDD